MTPTVCGCGPRWEFLRLTTRRCDCRHTLRTTAEAVLDVLPLSGCRRGTREHGSCLARDCRGAHDRAAVPWGTILINIVGSFVIGFFGTLTTSDSRFGVPADVRACVMIGLCGGFTTFRPSVCKRSNWRVTVARRRLLAISGYRSCSAFWQSRPATMARLPSIVRTPPPLDGSQ